MKFTVIGAASSYTPELIDGLFSWLDRLPVSEVWMMDPNAGRLEITAGLARRMAARNGHPFTIHTTGDLQEAVRDAAYVITQIRVGGIKARINDEKLGLRHGIIGQETTGVGGFACALRTIPPILDIAHAMEEWAPRGVLVNFTNPSGIVTESLFKHSRITSVGLCNVPICIIMDVVKYTGCAMEDVDMDYVGLNHLSWVRRFSIKGRDATQSVLAKFLEHADQEWTDPAVRDNMVACIRRLGLFLNGYLQYYYATEAVLDYLRKKEKTRGEEVLEVEQALFAKYQSPELNEKPEELSKRGGAHYSTAAFHLMSAIQNNTSGRQVVCCRNAGAIPGFDENAAVEVPAAISRSGASAIPQPVPPHLIRGLMQAVKAYESLTVDAAVSGDRDVAFQAMLAHPLMPQANACIDLLDELLEINRPHLKGTFFK